MKEMTKERKTLTALFATALLAILLLALAGCGQPEGAGNSSNGGDGSSSGGGQVADTTITVAATATPHAEILEDAVEPLLEEQGYSLEVKVYDDYALINDFTQDGSVDANFFQHVPYLDDYNAENSTSLVDIADVHIEPMRLYAGMTESLDGLEEGASVAIPNDPTNRARALLMLEEAGLVQLNNAVGDSPTAYDITDNPLNLQIIEMDASSCAPALTGVDIAAINTNFALEENLSDDLVLLTEKADPTYTNVLVTTAENRDDAKIQALAEALTSAEVADYIEDNFDGDIVAANPAR